MAIGLELDADGKVIRVGCRAQACAVGQSAAHLFATGAVGRSAGELVEAHDALAAWLNGDGGFPDWPGIELLVPARSHRGRHGAILLAWDAALAALASTPPPR